MGWNGMSGMRMGCVGWDKDVMYEMGWDVMSGMGWDGME